METDIFKTFRQVIVWGFPLYSHTHSYIHGAWVKTFKHLGINVYWFHDGDFPKEFDYSNTCFITEGWADNNIPLNSSSTYFVHIARNPLKYLSIGARLIEIRYNLSEIRDHNYEYVLPKDAIYISNETLYERVNDDSAVAQGNRRSVTKCSYEVAYMIWATDLLPHEFNYADAEATHSNEIYYIGTFGKGHPFFEFEPYAIRAGLKVKQIDPWKNPVSYEENITLMKRSYCAPDFRVGVDDYNLAMERKRTGKGDYRIGYIPCRVFKAISYGHTGITDSIYMKELLGEFVEFALTPADVLPLVEKRKTDSEWRKAAMRYVAENHTFIQRVRDLARILKINSYTTTFVYGFWEVNKLCESSVLVPRNPYLFFGTKDTIELAKKYSKNMITHYIELSHEKFQDEPWNEKIFMIEKAKQLNIFGSEYFVWVDGLDSCDLRPRPICQEQASSLKNHALSLMKYKLSFNQSEKNDVLSLLIHKDIVDTIIDLFKVYISRFREKEEKCTDLIILNCIYNDFPNLFYQLDIRNVLG